MTKKIKTGIIGLGCRGFSLLDTILACENAEIAAVCDVYPDRIDRAFEKICKKQKKQPAKYIDYRELLADGEIEAVLICSSWDEWRFKVCGQAKSRQWKLAELMI